MASSSASTRGRGPARRLAPGPAGDRLSAVQFVGHAGMAIRTEAGTPTRGHLDEALDIDVDRLELDVCSTADGELVVRHDVCVADGVSVGDLDLVRLRVLDPTVLTVDEVVAHLDGRVPVLLDIKMARAAEVLGVWFRRRRDLTDFALCTENISWLLHLRFAAPGVQRWPSFPDLGERGAHHVQRVLGGLWRSHSSLGGLRQGVADVHQAARHLRERPHESLGSLAGLPWRRHLPAELGQIRRDVAAAGVCVQHWSISEDLVDEAHRLGLHVNAWTVNNPFAARAVAAAGVDSITSDRVDLVRRALGPKPGTSPGADAPAIRAALRIVPS